MVSFSSMALPLQKFMHEEEEETDTGTPIRYVPLHHVYSATTPCVSASGSSNVMSKKVKARKLIDEPLGDAPDDSGKKRPQPQSQMPALIHVYTRRAKRPRHCADKPSFFYSFLKRVELESKSSNRIEPSEDFGGNQLGDNDIDDIEDGDLGKNQADESDVVFDSVKTRSLVNNNKKLGKCELLKLGVDSSIFRGLDGPLSCERSDSDGTRRLRLSKGRQKPDMQKGSSSASFRTKKWVELSFEDVKPNIFIGLECKVYWPLDDEWYFGRIVGYTSDRNQHQVQYVDGDAESLILSEEKVRFYLSREEMQQFNLRCSVKNVDINGLDYGEMVVLAVGFDDCQELEPGDIIWAKLTGHAMWPAIVLDEAHISARKGLKPTSAERSIPVQFFGTHDFARISMKQVISFLSGLLSSLHLKCKQTRFRRSLEEAKLYLSEQKLPKKMLKQQNNFSIDDCRNASGEEGSSDSDVDVGDEGSDKTLEGFQTCPLELGELRILRNEFSNSRAFLKYLGCKFSSEAYDGMPAGYRPVHIDWKDLDKCSVCHMDEAKHQSSKQLHSDPPTSLKNDYGQPQLVPPEYENNLFLQCDQCRMMVHARCYGELEPVDGAVWLCNLCSRMAKHPPPCCLCPVIGGAMKPTTDGRWAHLACAIWIPETCLSDVKRMEPIDGLNRINKDRWKLLCSICGVSYGACIQCSNNICRVAYHPLCARAAGLCVEPEDEDRLHLMSMDEDEDEEDQCIRLLSFCKRHRQPSNERCSPADEQTGQITRHCSNYNPPSNPSGCARTEPFDFRKRRGRKEPEALAAASLKRLYVENRPYLVTGYCQNGSLGNVPASSQLMAPLLSSTLQNFRTSQLETPKHVLSVAQKYEYMKDSFKKRLAFGKSGIHGFGIFAKQPHRAGDMVIEYTGELVRPPIADRREHFIYNSLVGAGTYMFRIDDEHVIDATRAGSIAHLINHSCEPNCYSRVISVHGDEHIIIFAKRDINPWEELTYDYRFFSIDEQLACYCGFPRCRGVVNDTEAEERMAKLCVPRSELIDWRGE